MNELKQFITIKADHLQVTSGDEINANPVGQRVAAAVDGLRCVERHCVNAEDGRPAEEELDDDDAQHYHDTPLASLNCLKVGVDAQWLMQASAGG